MSNKTVVRVIGEVIEPVDNGDQLCLQKVTYQHGNGENEDGFRFIRKDTAGRMKAQRGQANCISLDMINLMVSKWKVAHGGIAVP